MVHVARPVEAEDHHQGTGGRVDSVVVVGAVAVLLGAVAVLGAVLVARGRGPGRAQHADVFDRLPDPFDTLTELQRIEQRGR